MLTKSATFYCANLVNKKNHADMWTSSRRKKIGNEDKMHEINNYEIISRTIKFMEHASWRCKENSVVNNKLA